MIQRVAGFYEGTTQCRVHRGHDGEHIFTPLVRCHETGCVMVEGHYGPHKLVNKEGAMPREKCGRDTMGGNSCELNNGHSGAHSAYADSPCGICGNAGPRMYNDQPDCPGVAGCAKHREQCPYFYSTPHGSAGFQNDWARIIRCGYDVGHDGPHFPGNSQGAVLPQRANAEKEPVERLDRCPVCGEAWVVGPPTIPGSSHSLSCPYLFEEWHKEASTDVSKQHSTLHLQRRRKGLPQSANAEKEQATTESSEERQRLIRQLIVIIDKLTYIATVLEKISGQVAK
jgi:hypothetical protein